MSYDLQVLASHRDELLLAEVAAWLHMFGKYHEDFLSGNHALDVEIPSDIDSDFPKLHQLLTEPWPGPIWAQLPVSELGTEILSIFDLIKDHRNRNAPSGLARLMCDAHGRASGIEKGVLERFAPSQETTVYLARAVGFEPQPIDLSSLQNRRQSLYSFLQKQLQVLRDTGAHIDWSEFRTVFIRRLEQDFRISVADTRRPLNDVTMFDQTAASVALLKAALAQVLLAGWKDPVQNAVADKYKWRFLRIGINGPTFWGKASRLSDVLARRGCLEKALDDVCYQIETEYPLGAEIYRDENGSIFVVPDLDGILEATVNNRSFLAEIEAIARQDFSGEANFTCEVSPATRNMLFLGRLATAQLPAASAKPAWINDFWSQSAPKDICPVCGVRPQGPSKKASERKVCNVCEQRRIDRSQHWVAAQASTIWTDEIADETGRVALVVGAFDLETWFGGHAFNSIVMCDPAKRELTDPGRGNIAYTFDYQQLLADIREALRHNQFKGKTLLDRLVLNSQRGGGIRQFYEIQVIDSDLEAFHHSGAADDTLLALAMLRQNPSFARIRRVWKTTKCFWENISKSIPDIRQMCPRLEFTGEFSVPTGQYLRNNQACELVIGDYRLPVFCKDIARSHFLTIERLDYALKRLNLDSVAKLEEKLERDEYELELPGEYGAKHQKIGTLRNIKVKEEKVEYSPVIPILAEPRTFMALVPADKAITVVRAIKTKYEREMGKVRNRLPMTLGAVYFGRHTPLAAALDAGRRMINQTQASKAQVIAVKHKDVLPDGWPKIVELTLKIGERRVQVEVPTMMGDGSTRDVWYPYWQVASKPTDRDRWFKGPDDEHWVHVCDLRQDDRVAFTPSTFDFEYLDASARRFEVAYGDDGRRMGRDKKHRPYLLEEVEALEAAWEQVGRLSSSQIKALEALIEEKRQAWDEPVGTLEVSENEPSDKGKISKTFAEFVEDTLRNAKAPDSLRNAALTGMLADALEIHLTIHKDKAQQEDA
jgi:hypothetical protein